MAEQMPSTKLGTAYFTLLPSMDGTKAAIERELNGVGVSNASTRSGRTMGSAFSLAFTKASAVGNIAAMGIASVVGGFGDIAVAAMDASDSADKFRSTMDFAGIDTSTIDGLLKTTKDYADQTVYDLSDIRNITAQLAANGVEGYDQLAMAAGNLNAVAGGTSETFRSVGMVMTQTAGAGKLTTENWNQLADAIPGASGVLQEELRNMGAYTGDFRTALEKGEISAEEFLTAITNLGLTDEAAAAATSVDTFEGSIGNFNASVTSFATAVVDEFKTPFTDAMNSAAAAIGEAEAVVGPFFDGLETAFVELEPVFQPIVDKFGEVQDAVGSFADIYGPQMTDTFGDLEEKFPAFVEAITPVVDALGNIGGTVVQDGIIAVSTAITGISDAMTVVTAVLNGDWDLAWDSFTTLLTDLGTGLNDMVDTTFPGLVDGMYEIGTEISNTVTNVGNFFTGVFDEANSRLTTFGTEVGTWFDGKKDEFTTWATGVGETISTTFSGFVSDVGLKYTELKAGWDTFWADLPGNLTDWGAGVAETVGTGLGEVKTKWDEKWTEVSDGFSTWWTDNVATPFSGWLADVGVVAEEWDLADKFTTAVSTVQDILEAPFTAASDFISGIPDEIIGFFTGIGTRITEAIGSIDFPTPHITWEELTIFGMETPISLPHIDWYAKGGIVDGAQIIGVGERGPEAVVPLYGNEMQPFAEAIAVDLARMAEDNRGGGDVTYNISIDGLSASADGDALDLLRQFVAGVVEVNGGRRYAFA